MGTAARKPFWRYENTLLLLLAIGYAMIFADRFGITYLFPNIAEEFHLNNTQLGATVSILGFAWGISAIIFSYISDIFKKKKAMLVLFLIIFSLSTFWGGLATSFTGLLLSRAIMGIAEGPSAPLIQTTMMAESTESRRGLNTGIIISASSIIGSISPLIIVAIAQAYGWRYSLYIMTIPGLIVALLLMKFMREPQAVAESNTHKKTSWKDARIVLKSKNIWISIFAGIFNIGFMIVGFSAFAPLYLMNVGHFSQSQSAAIMSVYGVMAFLWNIIVTWISDRMGRKPAVIGAALSGILLFSTFLLFPTHYMLLIGACILFSAGQALGSLLFFIIPGESVPIAFMATTTALINFAGEIIGGTIGPAFGGALADKYSLSMPILMTVAASVIVFLLTLAYMETHPRKVKNNHIVTDNTDLVSDN